MEASFCLSDKAELSELSELSELELGFLLDLLLLDLEEEEELDLLLDGLWESCFLSDLSYRRVLMKADQSSSHSGMSSASRRAGSKRSKVSPRR